MCSENETNAQARRRRPGGLLQRPPLPELRPPRELRRPARVPRNSGARRGSSSSATSPAAARTAASCASSRQSTPAHLRLSSSGASGTQSVASTRSPPPPTSLRTCDLCGIKILPRVRAESSRRPPRHRAPVVDFHAARDVARADADVQAVREAVLRHVDPPVARRQEVGRDARRLRAKDERHLRGNQPVCRVLISRMTPPCWLRRAVMNRHRHAIEQASHRWRGGRREDSATRRKILISTQSATRCGSGPRSHGAPSASTEASWPRSEHHSSQRGTARTAAITSAWDAKSRTDKSARPPSHEPRVPRRARRPRSRRRPPSAAAGPCASPPGRAGRRGAGSRRSRRIASRVPPSPSGGASSCSRSARPPGAARRPRRAGRPGPRRSGRWRCSCGRPRGARARRSTGSSAAPAPFLSASRAVAASSARSKRSGAACDCRSVVVTRGVGARSAPAMQGSAATRQPLIDAQVHKILRESCCKLGASACKCFPGP